jgi:hypothetical protein
MRNDYSDVKTREAFLKALESDFGHNMRRVEYTVYSGNWRDLWDGKNDHVFHYHVMLSFGDYDNSTQVERSNVRALLDYRYNGVFGRCRWISSYSGSHGWMCAGFVESDLPATSIFYGPYLEMLHDLEDYLLLDEGLFSAMELEAEDEAWESWIEGDLRRELYGRVPNIDDIESADLWSIVAQAMERENEYFIHEAGGNVWLDLDKIVPAVIALLTE